MTDDELVGAMVSGDRCCMIKGGDRLGGSGRTTVYSCCYCVTVQYIIYDSILICKYCCLTRVCVCVHVRSVIESRRIIYFSINQNYL